MDASIEPFHLQIPEAQLQDLKRRLAATRWPEDVTEPGWTQGVPLEAAKSLCAHWLERYDWRRCEAQLNDFGQFTTEIDGAGIHFLHVRSKHANALPLLLTHGWPGSVVEFLKVVKPLTDPLSHGGTEQDAFHLVIPSLPGYGFSEKPAAAGWGVARIAAAWAELMQRLGYTRYVAQGGDWGSAVTTAMARLAPAGLAAIHLNMVIAMPNGEDMASLTEAEQKALADIQRFTETGSGYSALQSTRPQTLGYGLTDSPAGQAMWIYEKLAEWSDNGGHPGSVLAFDDMLDNIMLYWLPATAASSARLYWESFRSFDAEPIALPVACSIFPGELLRPSRRWAERKYPNLLYWGEPAKGGHFAAFEQPEIFVGEMRAAFRGLPARL
jgi:pimeloyl-ACP methyl ester carboxylesterase